MEGGDEGIEMVVDSKDLQQQRKTVDKLTDGVEDRQLDSTRVQECDVVEISDDEESLVPEIDGFKPKEEGADYDSLLHNMCSGHGAGHSTSSSRSNIRSSFLGMGFTPYLVDKAIEENGIENVELLLETLFGYAAHHNAESCDSLDSLFDEDTKQKARLEGDLFLKEEIDVCNRDGENKMASLLKMNFSVNEVSFAIDKLGRDAPIGQLMDFIFAARVAKKYEKAAVVITSDVESKEDYSNEALFVIMEKTLRLLEIGFSEQEISAAFENCGSKVSLQELTDSIVSAQLGDDCANSDRNCSTSLDNSSSQINIQTLKRTIQGYLNNQPCGSLSVKSGGYHRPDDAAQVGISDFLERLKGKRPKEECVDEPKILKKPKENEDMRNSLCEMWLEGRRRNFTSTSRQVPASQKQLGCIGSVEEDRKPLIPIPIPCKSLTSVVAKPPYFFYGNVTNLSLDSWAKVSQFLYSVQPECVNADQYSALQRREGYVHNLPTDGRFRVLPKAPLTIGEAIPHARKWWPLWDTRKQLSDISFETSGVSVVCGRLGRMLTECKGIVTMGQQKEVVEQCQSLNLIWVGQHKLAPLEPEHLERIMGYPSLHSRVAGCSLSERLKSLKLAFQTDALGYHLSVLKPLFPGGISVLSFFSGIGGELVALHRLGIRLKGVVSVEPCETKRRIVKQWWENSGQGGELIQVESSHKLSSNKLEELIKKFGGFHLVICQNPYSAATSDDLTGLDFSLFVEFVRVLQRVRTVMETTRNR